jgi:hypothetical protein
MQVMSLGYKSVAHYLIQTRQKPASSDQAPSSEIEAAVSDITAAAKENMPNTDIICEKTDEISATNDEEMMEKQQHRVKRGKRGEHFDSISPGPIAARLRRRHYGI